MASAEDGNKMARGETAKHCVQFMADTFAKLQASYLADLVMAQRNGGDIHTPASMLAVLDDVVEDLQAMVETGKRTAKRVERGQKPEIRAEL